MLSDYMKKWFWLSVGQIRGGLSPKVSPERYVFYRELTPTDAESLRVYIESLHEGMIRNELQQLAASEFYQPEEKECIMCV